MLRTGRTLTEAELAEAAAEALDAGNVSRSDAARALGVSRSALTMALDPARYPDRGHALRVRLVEQYGDLAVEGPLYRLVRKSES